MLETYTALLTEVKKVLEKEGFKALLVEVSNPGVVWIAQGQVEKLSELFAVFHNNPTEELSDDKSSPVLQTLELSQILQALINFRAVFAKCPQGAKFTNTQLVNKKVTQTQVDTQSASIQENLNALLTAIQENLTQAYRTQLFQFDTTKAQDTQLTQLATDIQQLLQDQFRLSKLKQQSFLTFVSLLESFLTDISAVSAEQKTALLQALRLKLNPPITLTTRVQAVTSKPVDEAALKVLEATALKLLSEPAVVGDDATRKMLAWLNSSDSAEIKKDDIATHFAKVNWVPALDNAHLPQTLDKLIVLKDKLSLAKTLANGEVANEIEVILTSVQKKFAARVDALLSEIPADTSNAEKTVLLQELRLKLNPPLTLIARLQVATTRSSSKPAGAPALEESWQKTALNLLNEVAIVESDATRKMLVLLNSSDSAEIKKEDIATHFAKVNWVPTLDDAQLPQDLDDLIVLKGKLATVRKLASSEVAHEIDIILASIQKKFNALHAGIVHQCEQTLPEEPQQLLVLKADLLKLKQHEAVQTIKNQTDNTLQKLQDKLDEHYVNQIITICDTDLSATAFSDITEKYPEAAQLDVLLKKLATTLGKDPAHLRQLLKKLQAASVQPAEPVELSTTNTAVPIIEKITKVLIEERHKVDPMYLLFAGLQQNRLNIAASAVTHAVSNVIGRWKKSAQPAVTANPLLPYLEQASEWDDILDNELLPTELDKLLSLKQNLSALKVTDVESNSAKTQKTVLQKIQTKIDQIQFAKLQTILITIKDQFIGDDSIGQQESLAKLTQSINLPAELLPLLDEIAKQHSSEDLRPLLTGWVNALSDSLGTPLNLYRTLRLIQTLALSKISAQLTPTATASESIGSMSVINTLLQTLSEQQAIKPVLDQYYREKLTAILMTLTYKELLEFVTINAQRTSVFGGPSVIQKTPVLLTAFLQAVDELARENPVEASLKQLLDNWVATFILRSDALTVYRTLRLLQITQQMPQTANVKPDNVVMTTIASMVLKLQENFVAANSVEWLFAELSILIATAKVDENYHQIAELLAKFANNEDLLAPCDAVLENLITQDNVVNFPTDLIKKLDLIAEIVHDGQSSKDGVAKIKDKIEARKKAVFGISISGTIAVELGVGNTNRGANRAVDANGDVTSLLDCHMDSGDKAQQPTDGDNMPITLEETDLIEEAAFLLLMQLECLDENSDKDIQKLIDNLSGFDILAEVNGELVNRELIATQLKKLITTEESANQVIANLVLINRIVENKHENFVNPINPIFDDYRHIKVDDNYIHRIVINIGAIKAKVQEHKTLLAQNQFFVSQLSSTAQLSAPLLQQHRIDPNLRTKSGNGGSSLADTEAPIGRTFGTGARSSSFVPTSSANSTSNSTNAELSQIVAMQEIFYRIHAELLVSINATLAKSGFFTSATGEPVTKLDLTGDTISSLVNNLETITVVVRGADADRDTIRRQYPMLHVNFSELANQNETFRKELVLFEMIHDAIAVLKQSPTSDTLAKIKEQFFVTSTFGKEMSEDLILRHFIRTEDIDDIEDSDLQSVQRPSLSARLSATGLSREFILINSNLCKILLKHNESNESDVQVLMNKAIRHLRVTTDAHLIYAKSILRSEFKKQATSKDEVNEVKQTLDNGDNDSLIRQIESQDSFNLQTINKASSSLEIATAKLYATLKLAEILKPLTLEKSSTERAVGLANYYAKLEEYRPVFNLNRDTFIQRFLRAINYYLGLGFLQEKNKVSDLTFFGQPKGGQFAQKAARLVGIPELGFENWPVFPWQRPAPTVA